MQGGAAAGQRFASWFHIALINLVLSALMGVVLRLAFVTEIPFLKFKAFLHGHSHVAMIGWGYLAIFALLMHYFGRSFVRQGLFAWLFAVNQVSVVGMLISFPIFGYKAVPIFFTTCHLFASYAFIYLFLKGLTHSGKKGFSVRFIRTALYFQAISTLGIWCLVPTMILDLKNSVLYHMSVQFYLHFQFNGWFIFAVIGLLIYVLERRRISLPTEYLAPFFKLLVISCFLTYALAVTWSSPIDLIFWINSLGVAIQTVALYYFIRVSRILATAIKGAFQGLVLYLFYITAICFVLKNLIQGFVILPDIAVVAYTIRNFVIGFIHLLLLGIVTHALFLLALEERWLLSTHRSARVGVIFFTAGFIVTESLLTAQGLMLWAGWGFIPHYYLWLALLSILLPVGAALLYRSRGAGQAVSA